MFALELGDGAPQCVDAHPGLARDVLEPKAACQAASGDGFIHSHFRIDQGCRGKFPSYGGQFGTGLSGGA